MNLLLAAALLLASPPPAGTLLVGNKGEDTLSFIDLASGRELARLPTGRMPHEIAISPDGRQAAVVAYGGASLDLFDIAARRRLRSIALGPNQGPHGLVWLADGRLVATTERSRSLTLVDPARGDAVSAVPTNQEGTHMVAVAPGGRLAFTANIAAGTVSVIDLAARRKLRDVAIGGAPEGIALTPDGSTLWVADLEGARVLAFDAAALANPNGAALTPQIAIPLKLRGGSRAEVETALIAPLERELRALPDVASVETKAEPGAGTVTATLRPGADLAAATPLVAAALRRAGAAFPKGRAEAELRPYGAAPLAIVATGPRPIRVAISPDGRFVVTSDFESGSLTLIDAATHAKIRTLPVSGTADAAQVTILFSADGRRLYVAETGPDTVAELDFPSGRLLRRLKSGRDGDGLAIAP
jgi:YVTN family beta-propeller protein